MRQFTEHEETRELIHELEVNDIEFETREHGRIYVNITNGDTLEGIWSIKYEPYWGAYKMIWFYQDSNNEIQGAKTVAFNIQQVVENVLAD